MGCCVHRMLDELDFLMFHSNFYLISKIYKFWCIINEYKEENVDFDEQINDKKINRYLNEDLENEYWNRKLI